MAEPYDFLLAKYIEIGKENLPNPNFTPESSMFDARQSAMDNFNDTYTEDEYNTAMNEAYDYIQQNYSNNFARVPD